MMQICYTFNDVISCGKDIFVQMKSHLIKSELQNFRMTFQNARFDAWLMLRYLTNSITDVANSPNVCCSTLNCL